MPKGKAVSPDIQAIIIRLSPLMGPDEISMYTGIGLRTVQDILKTFNETGHIRESKARRGKPQRALGSTDEEVKSR
jgi:transposase